MDFLSILVNMIIMNDVIQSLCALLRVRALTCAYVLRKVGGAAS